MYQQLKMASYADAERAKLLNLQHVGCIDSSGSNGRRRRREQVSAVRVGVRASADKNFVCVLSNHKRVVRCIFPKDDGR